MPGRHGGIAIPNPIKTSDREFASSQQITMPLTDLNLANSSYLPSDTITEMSILKKQIHRQNRAASLSAIDDLRPRLDDDRKRAVELASEKGASSWLTALSLTEHGFSLHKRAFRDALALHYGWLRSPTPIHCDCGSSFSIEHSLSCHKGGFTTLRHNEVRDITARLLTEVCHEVRVAVYAFKVSDYVYYSTCIIIRYGLLYIHKVYTQSLTLQKLTRCLNREVIGS